jgi:hypothetical protein
MIAQPSLFGDEPRRPELDQHAKPVEKDGRLYCPRCKGLLNRKCPATCPECTQAIDRRALR